MTREIPLSRGMVAIVDDEDHEMVTSFGKWYADRSCQTFYARKNFWRDGRCRSLRMHRVILGVPLVDHVNGDGLDNRRANLRPATDAQNAMNRRLRTDNRSGFTGVYWHRQRGVWVASIWRAKRHQHLGIFPTAEQAARAYDAAATTHFGEFARLNFPQEIAS